MTGTKSNNAVRTARVSDAEALVGVFQESWRFAYQGIIPHLQLERIIERRGADWWACQVKQAPKSLLVVDVGGRVAGYANFGVARGRSVQRGEIYELYLAPDYHGMGLGEGLFEASRHALDMRCLKGLIVWALSENTSAMNFYWGRGGWPTACKNERIGGTALEKIAFTWD
ncbi:MAG: hypothetical protein RLZ98_889 [Pseudomonadota bacterium]|jgi:ribosomal protein S18 acetylase RimI-like enzyme